MKLFNAANIFPEARLWFDPKWQVFQQRVIGSDGSWSGGWSEPGVQTQGNCAPPAGHTYWGKQPA